MPGSSEETPIINRDNEEKNFHAGLAAEVSEATQEPVETDGTIPQANKPLVVGTGSELGISKDHDNKDLKNTHTSLGASLANWIRRLRGKIATGSSTDPLKHMIERESVRSGEEVHLKEKQ